MARLAALDGTPVAAGLETTWPEFGEPEREASLRMLNRGKWWRTGTSGEEGQVARFERDWARFHDADRCVAVCNGTIALMVSLWALGIRHGDEVIVPGVTFIATSNAVVFCGGVPVFVDVVSDTYQIDPDEVEEAITDRTKAVIVVHYGGYPCDMDRIKAVAEKHGLPVIEDCAQAQGTEWRGRKVGAHVTCGTFSFQQNKSLTSGEGGAVTTDDPRLADQIWAVHYNGRPYGLPNDDQPVLGGNFRLGEWQGAVLRAQLQRFPEQNARREETAARLRRGLKEMDGLKPLKEDDRITHRGFYFFVIRYRAESFGGVDRSAFLKALRAEGVPCGPGYRVPVYKNPVYAERAVAHRVMPCPTADRVCAEEQVCLRQTALLHPANADLILEACEKVRTSLDELRQLEEM